MNNLASLLVNPIVVTITIPVVAAWLALVAGRAKTLPSLITVAATVVGLMAAVGLALRAFSNPLVERLDPTSWSLHLANPSLVPAWQMSFAFRADALAATMLVGLALLFFVAAIYSHDRAGSNDLPSHYFFFLLLAYAGANGTVLAGDLLMLYVSWEITTLACAALILQPLRAPNVSAAKAFVAASLATSIPMFFGIVWLLARLGSVDLQTLRAVQPAADLGPVGLVVGAMLLAFAVRAGAVPVHTWLTRATDAAIAPVGLILDSALTILGAYAVIRVLLPIFAIHSEWTPAAIAVVGAISAILGPIGALRSFSYKSALAYLAVGQMGLVLLPLGTPTAMGEGATLLQLVGFCTSFPLLFIGVSELHRVSATERRWYQRLEAAPAAFAATVMGALALAGMPPLSGFAPRILAFQALLDARTNLASGLAVIVFLATALSAAAAINLLHRALSSEAEPSEVDESTNIGAKMAIAILMTLTLGLGLVPEFLLRDLVQPMAAAAMGNSASAVSLSSDAWIQAGSPILVVISLFAGVATYLRQGSTLQAVPYGRAIRALGWPGANLSPLYRALAFLLQGRLIDATVFIAIVINALASVAHGAIYLAVMRHAPDPDSPWDYQEDQTLLESRSVSE